MNNDGVSLHALAQHQVFWAGGWTTGQKVAPTGEIMLRTDTYNAYFRTAGGTKFIPELRPGENIVLADLSREVGLGSYAIAMCETNPDTRYILTQTYLYRTEDNGESWVKTSLPQQVATNPNLHNRMWGNPLEVDPKNGQHVIFSGALGTYISTDGFRTFTAVPLETIPATASVDGNQTHANVAFDPTSPVVNGRSQRFCIWINGDSTGGLYEAEDGGASFTKLPATTSLPTRASEVKYGPNGWIYVSGNANNDQGGQLRIRRKDTNAWVEPNKTPKMVAFDPINAGWVYGTIETLRLDRSKDGGLNWELDGADGAAVITDPGEAHWMGYAGDKSYKGGSSLDFDASGRLYSCGGVGPWECTVMPPTTTIQFSSTCTWRSIATGVENTVVDQVKFAPNGNFGASKMDRGIIAIPAGEVGRKAPSKYGLDNLFQFAQGLDFAFNDYDCWWGASSSGGKHIGHTPNLNKDWFRVDEVKALSGGRGGGQVIALAKDVTVSIQLTTTPLGAANAAKNSLWLKFKNSAPVMIPIGNNNAVWGSQFYYIHRCTLLKDESIEGRFWFYNPGDVANKASADHLACVGAWRIDVNMVTGEFTVTRRSSTSIWPIGETYDFHIKQLGPDHFIVHSNTDQNGLMETKDGMTAWQEVLGDDDQGDGDRWGAIEAIGVGLGPNNTRNGTEYVVGHRRQGSSSDGRNILKRGHWKRDLNTGPWKLIGRAPDGNFHRVNDIAGHPLRTDTFVVGTAGFGIQLISNEDSFRGI